MRIVQSVVLILIGLAPLAAQQDRTRIPKKGEAVLIKGCLRGSSVQNATLMTVDTEGKQEEIDGVPSYTYRLQGDKKLLKDLKEKHDRKVVEVKGILRSSLTGSGIGTTVGRTRITIGGDPNGARGVDQPLPVLEAIAFEGRPVSCK
jgi:hypothetical protein